MCTNSGHCEPHKYRLVEVLSPWRRGRADTQVKVLLNEFQNLSPTDPHFETSLKNLWASLSAHIKEEETDNLPKLEKALDASESKRLADEFQSTKKFVPTRSHPMAPDKPVSARQPAS